MGQAVLGSFGSMNALSPQIQKVATRRRCNSRYTGKETNTDFHTGQRFVEISAMNDKDWGLKWSTQMQIVCSLRATSQIRGPLWRGRVLSNESMQTVQALKRAKGDRDLIDKVFQTKVSRLVKADLVAVLAELQRQGECDLALQVFDAMREEVWYKPDLSVYARMIVVLKENGLIEKIEPLFATLKEEHLQPDTRAFTLLMGAFIRVGMAQQAIETYELMKQSGCNLDEAAFTVLIKGLTRLKEPDLADIVRKEYAQYLDGSLEVLEDTVEEVVTS